VVLIGAEFNALVFPKCEAVTADGASTEGAKEREEVTKKSP